MGLPCVPAAHSQGWQAPQPHGGRALRPATSCGGAALLPWPTDGDRLDALRRKDGDAGDEQQQWLLSCRGRQEGAAAATTATATMPTAVMPPGARDAGRPPGRRAAGG
eukprot:scaffold2773_cov410-Prasinococcus_capsulatus_cf.AAC.20